MVDEIRGTAAVVTSGGSSGRGEHIECNGMMPVWLHLS